MTDFSYTGSSQTYTVPSGVTEIDVLLYGGAGGSDGAIPPALTALGGVGAMVRTRLTVTPGDVLDVYVGGKGGDGNLGAGPSYVGTAGAGGYNGGAAGGHVSTGTALQLPAGGGGGATDVRDSGTRLAVAGGGGGAGGNGTDVTVTLTFGGDGGYPDGEDGEDGAGGNTNSFGAGGTTSAGGAGGTYVGTGVNGTAGSANTGGAGAVIGRGGGGGGGGVYGGGGGGGSNTPGTSGGGGGGGSSMTTGTLLSSGVAPTRDHGFVRIVPVNRGGWRLGKLGFGVRSGGFS